MNHTLHMIGQNIIQTEMAYSLAIIICVYKICFYEQKTIQLWP